MRYTSMALYFYGKSKIFLHKSLGNFSVNLFWGKYAFNNFRKYVKNADSVEFALYEYV